MVKSFTIVSFFVTHLILKESFVTVGMFDIMYTFAIGTASVMQSICIVCAERVFGLD